MQYAVASKESFMRNHRSTQPRPLPQILWLHITLSERFDAAAVEQWRRRLHDQLSAHGLVAATSLTRIAVLSVGSAITPPDRGLVVGWLMAQAEVVFVQIERRTRAPRSTLFQRPSPGLGRSLSPHAPRPMRPKDRRTHPFGRAGPG
jgi:hypothetical protein